MRLLPENAEEFFSGSGLRRGGFRERLFLFSLALIFSGVAHASSPGWAFHPTKIGNVLIEGGWSLDYTLGEINASPEFSFPLQLVYLNTHESRGFFGSQWFCPQLESGLVPKGTGFLLWTMPSGGQVGFKPNPEHQDEFVSFDGKWHASRVGPAQIWNDEGWRLSYSKGRLDSVQSPTGRVLDFQWSGWPEAGTLELAVQIRDPASGEERVLLGLKFGENCCVSTARINGLSHRFEYIRDGLDDRLSGLLPPLGNPARFLYLADSGILSRVETLTAEKDSAEFQCVFVPPFEAGKPSQEPDAPGNPKNYRLTSDKLFDYEYPGDPKIKDRMAIDRIIAKSRTGLTLEINQSPARGIVASKTGGTETKTYFYRAPGQKYDGKLRRVETDGQLNIEHRYDRKTGLLSETLDADGTSTFFEYPKDWKPTPLIEPKPARILRGLRAQKEVVAEFAYDDLGRVISAKDAAGQATEYSYTPRGDLDSVTDPEGGKKSFTHDAFGRRVSVAWNDIKESVEFDDDGRVKTRISPDGARTEFSFDKQGRLAAVSRNGSPVVEFFYDGRITGEKDPLGRIKTVEHDTRGNILSETAPDGAVTRYEYDPFNRCTAQIDGNGNKITFAYDPVGRLIRQTNPLGGTLTWIYDEKDRLTGRDNGERMMKYTYNAAGKLARLDYGNGEHISYEYDEKLVSAVTPETRCDYSYDKLGRVEAACLRQGGRQFLLRYRHNARSQRTGLMLASLSADDPFDGPETAPIQQTEYTYDASGRLASILSNGQPVVSCRYDSAGRPALKTFGNGMSASLSYDNAGRLAGIGFSGGPRPLDLLYQWDPANQLTSRTWNGDTQIYTYDPSGQLLKVTDGKTNAVLESYAYDKAGNMTEKTVAGKKTTMTYDAANQIVSSTSPGSTNSPGHPASNISFTYDRAGRLTGSSGGPTRTYGWLDKVTTLTTPAGESIRFAYWPDGQIASKKVFAEGKDIQKISTSPAAADETFLWDGLALLLRNDTVYIIEPHPSGGVPIASHPVNKPDDLTYYLNDLLGTTLATVERGTIRFASLSAFGQRHPVEIPKPTGLSGPPVPTPPFADPVTNINPTTNQRQKTQ